MKKNLLFLAIISLVIVSCTKSEKIKKSKEIKEEITKIPFKGTWARNFKMGKGVEAKVTYTIFEDRIQYEMNGPMQMKYSIKKDTFLVKENKWIGTKSGTPYVIFIKNNTKEAITLLKMKLKTKEEGMTMPFPSDTARSKFSSWNTYKKQ